MDPIKPITGPIDLRKDTLTGVIFNANDATQLAAHPNNTSMLTKRSIASPYEDYATKAASPIAQQLVRSINNPSSKR